MTMHDPGSNPGIGTIGGMRMKDYCVMCGEIIPEGRQVCPNCESKWKSEKSDLSFNRRKINLTIKRKGGKRSLFSLFCFRRRRAKSVCND